MWRARSSAKGLCTRVRIENLLLLLTLRSSAPCFLQERRRRDVETELTAPHCAEVARISLHYQTGGDPA